MSKRILARLCKLKINNPRLDNSFEQQLSGEPHRWAVLIMSLSKKAPGEQLPKKSFSLASARQPERPVIS